MSKLERESIGKYIKVLTDYHSNGSYETLKDNITLLREKDYAIMIRTLNFERDDFKDDLIYVDKKAYEYLTKSKVQPNDILTNKIANPGSIYIMPDLECHVTCGMNLFLIRFSNDVNQRYMYYCMKNSEAYIKSFAHGTTTKTITKDEVKSIDLLIHTDRREQDKIEHLLTSIDKKIELNKKINDNLEQQAKLLYDYWFSQFDFPDKNGKPYCSAGGKMVWNEQLKRNIPENWKVVPLSTVLNFKSGFSFSSDLYVTEGKYKLLTIKNVQDSGINLNVDNYINDVPSNVPDYCFLKVNDILMSLTGNVGRIGIMYDSGCLLNQRVALAKSVNEDLHSFVYFLLKSDIVRKQYETIANGSSQKNLSPIEAENVLFAYNEQIATRFASITNKYLKIIVSNLAENQNLIRLRDWLLPMLMNGQATISD